MLVSVMSQVPDANPELSAELVRLTGPQRRALMMLVERERRLGQPLQPGDAGVYGATWVDRYTVGIHWKTADALKRRGFVSFDPYECSFDEPCDLFLTDAGRRHIDGIVDSE